ncbi:hypothetical protein NQ318_015272, partial [Aromia moschata]
RGHLKPSVTADKSLKGVGRGSHMFTPCWEGPNACQDRVFPLSVLLSPCYGSLNCHQNHVDLNFDMGLVFEMKQSQVILTTANYLFVEAPPKIYCHQFNLSYFLIKIF